MIATAVTSIIVVSAARYSLSGLIGLGCLRLLIRGVYLSSSELLPFLLQLPLSFQCIRVLPPSAFLGQARDKFASISTHLSRLVARPSRRGQSVALLSLVEGLIIVIFICWIYSIIIISAKNISLHKCRHN